MIISCITLALPLFLLVSLGDQLGPADHHDQRFGWQKVLVHVGELTSDEQRQLSPEEGIQFSVGFLYDSWPTRGVSFWNADGRYVIYQTSQKRSAELIETEYTYWTMTDADWQGLLGDSAASRFSKPWQYRFPLATTILVPVATVGMAVLAQRLWKKRKLRIRRGDTQFAAAVGRMFDGKGEYVSRLDPDLIDQEILTLARENVTEHEARVSLLVQVNDECRRRCKALKDRLIDASDFAETGKIATCHEVLSDVGLALDAGSPHDLPVLQQIAVLQQATAYDPEQWLLLWQLLRHRTDNSGAD